MSSSIFSIVAPALSKVVTDGIKEILKNYNVDGIHFDDYFYPTTSSAFDDEEYDEYDDEEGYED